MLIDPEADRWVLVDALEAAARLLVATHGDEVLSQAIGPTDPMATAAALLATSAEVRSAIHQPVAPTEATDLAWTRGRLASARFPEAGRPATPGHAGRARDGRGGRARNVLGRDAACPGPPARSGLAEGDA